MLLQNNFCVESVRIRRAVGAQGAKGGWEAGPPNFLTNKVFFY